MSLSKKPGKFGKYRKQLRCSLLSQHAPLHAGEKKDTMLTLVIHVLTIMLWAAAAVAVFGIASGSSRAKSWAGQRTATTAAQ